MTIDAILQNWTSLLISLAICAAGCTAIEFLLSKREPIFSRMRGALFWAICLLGMAVGVVSAQTLLRAAGAQPLISLELSAGEYWLTRPLLVVLLALLPALIFDFFYCWSHRLQHAVPFLWRFHAVHHAIEDLNGTNCYHHWTEEFVRPVLIFIPLSLLIDLRVPEIMVISAITNSFWSHFVHLNLVNVGFGPLDRILVTPSFHRVHHSRSARHFDKNFAGLLTIWDIVFGTAHFPTRQGRREMTERVTATTAEKFLRDIFAVINPQILQAMRAKQENRFRESADQYDGVVIPHIEANIIQNLAPYSAGGINSVIDALKR